MSPATGQPFEGLSGTESNPDASGQPVTVFKIEPTTPNAYFMPGADPGEGYMATNSQLFGSTSAPPTSATVPAMQGFVKDFAYTLSWESHTSGYTIVPGTTANDIMGCFTPEALPVLSALARGYAVCDHWYAFGAHRDAAQPGLRLRRHQPGAHGRQDAHVHLPVDLRPAQQPPARLVASTGTTPSR